jgi:hypothetical protein
MTVAHYVRIIEQRFDALLGLDGDRLLIVSNTPLPRAAATALAGYAAQLIWYFESGRDSELSLEKMEQELRALGLMQMGNGAWTHPSGDDMADLIVAGVLDPTAPVNPTRRDAPHPTPVEAEQVRPGTFKWTEPRGVRVVPMFRGRRLTE